MAAEVLTSELREDYDSRGTAALPGSRYQFLLDFLKQGVLAAATAAAPAATGRAARNRNAQWCAGAFAGLPSGSSAAMLHSN